MFKYSIDSKSIVSNVEFGEYLDLTEPVLKISDNIKYVDVYRVSEEMVMRPDLISQSAYGTDEYTELILKYNDISNPFSIAEGDIIIIPTLDSIRSDVGITDSTTATNGDAAIRLARKYVDSSKFTNNTSSNQVSIPKDTEANIASEGATTVRVSDNKIYCGESEN